MQPLVTAESPMTYRIATDNADPQKGTEVVSSPPGDTVSLSRATPDAPLYTSSGRLEASRQVDLHERSALRGDAGKQYSFHFASGESSRHNSHRDTLVSDIKGKISRQVTKREKKGLLNSSINQYTLNLYD
jgi:hypothetical protein